MKETVEDKLNRIQRCLDWFMGWSMACVGMITAVIGAVMKADVLIGFGIAAIISGIIFGALMALKGRGRKIQ